MDPIRMMCVIGLLVLAGCASAPAQGPAVIEVGSDDIARYWVPKEGTVDMRTPFQYGPSRPLAQRVVVDYLIDSDGEVREARVLKAEPAGASAGWALTAVRAFSYQPTADNPTRTPVRRTHEITLGAPAGAVQQGP